MRQMMQPRLRSADWARRIGFAAAAGLCLAAFAAPATGQSLATSAPAADVYPGIAVSLVRQDASDCTNSNVSDSDPSLALGMAWVARQKDGTTIVNVAMTVQPNTVYHFFLKCVRLLGDIRTDDDGIGQAVFTFPTNSVGPVFAFDMYPEGSPPGNKFQSVRVAF